MIENKKCSKPKRKGRKEGREGRSKRRKKVADVTATIAAAPAVVSQSGATESTHVFLEQHHVPVGAQSRERGQNPLIYTIRTGRKDKPKKRYSG